MSKHSPKTEHTGKIPHFHHQGATFFITTHLHGSVPFDLLKKLRFERDEEIANLKKTSLQSHDLKNAIYMVRRKYFYQYDELLDACETSPTWLRLPEVATIVERKIHKYDGQYYNLIAFTIMPNHIHLVLDFSVQTPVKDMDTYINVSKVMNFIKGGSAYEVNKLLQLDKPFWQNSYHDRYIRNFHHYLGAVNYTINNIVKAKLYKHWIDHEFTWVCENFQKKQLIYPTLW
ncbi:MAG: transposase [Saprospiraceae bacterium]